MFERKYCFFKKDVIIFWICYKKFFIYYLNLKFNKFYFILVWYYFDIKVENNLVFIKYCY